MLKAAMGAGDSPEAPKASGVENIMKMFGLDPDKMKAEFMQISTATKVTVAEFTYRFDKVDAQLKVIEASLDLNRSFLKGIEDQLKELIQCQKTNQPTVEILRHLPTRETPSQDT